MASPSNSSGSRTGKSPVRSITPAIKAAPVDRKAQPRIASASVVAPVRVEITLLDAHTLAPVDLASVGRLVVEHVEGNKDAQQILRDSSYASLDAIPKTPSVFTASDQAALDKLSAEIDATPRPKPRSVKERDSLVARKRAWTEFTAFLQSLVQLLCAVKGFTPAYTGPSDGSGWADFETNHLAPVYAALAGKPFVTSVRLSDAAKVFVDAVSKTFRTNAQGKLVIAVPRGKKGSITLELLHLKITSPADSAKLGPDPVLRAQYDLRRGTYDADLPGSSEEKSRWRLELSADPSRSAPLRNFIRLDYDATKTPAHGLVAEHTVHALVWCQPTWFEPTSNVPVPDKSVFWEPGTHTPDATARRGMKSGFPTLTVSTTYSPWSHWYGSYTAAGRRKAWTWKSTLREDSKGLWHVYQDKPRPWTLSNAEFDLETLKAWLQEYKPDPADRHVYDIISRRVKVGAKVFIPGLGDVTVPKGQTKLYECFIRRNRETYTTPEAAFAVAFKAATKWNVNDPGPYWCIRNDPDGPVEYRILNPESVSTYTSIRPFLEHHPEIIAPKMHHGIDCAGDVGDPVFATCGGRLEHHGKDTYNNSSAAAGLYARIRIWRKGSGISRIETLHMRDLAGKSGMPVKAGDLVGTMGRTGNPESASPTHAHFQCGGANGGIPLQDCPVPGYEAVFPHNQHPKLLPCGADYWDVPKVSPASSPGTDFNADPRSAKRCRGIPAHSNNRENWIAASCWAFAENRCPHGMNPTVLAKLREEDRRLDAEKKAAEKKAAKKP